MHLAVEAEIVQNSALGATLLWAFTTEYCANADWQFGPDIPLVLPVLPIAFHQESVKSLHSRNYEGGLDLALAESRLLTLDLQERMEAMLPQTMLALSVAFRAGLMTYISESGQLRSTRRTNPFHLNSVEVRQMLSVATRLGYWFRTVNHERLGSLLRIRL